MLQLKCTKKVLKELGLNPDDLSKVRSPDTPLGNWYVNLFLINRRKAFLFMNERTLFSFVLIGVRKTFFPKLLELFFNGLEKVLTLEGFDRSEIDDVLAGYKSLEFTKTDSRILLGNVVDLVNLYKAFITSEGGLDNCDYAGIVSKINRTPQRNLGWLYSIDIVRELLRGNMRHFTQ